MLAFNLYGRREISEVGDERLVQAGSIGKRHKQLTPPLIERITQAPLKPSQHLACALSLLQSLGVNDYLLERGVGGAFCGAYITPSAIDWQSDVLFNLWQPNHPNPPMVSCIVRDHVLIVHSNISESCRYFASSISCGPIDAWKTRWSDATSEFTQHLAFDFISFINVGNPTVTVVETRRQQSSRHLYLQRLATLSKTEALRARISISPELHAIIMTPSQLNAQGETSFQINFVAYESPDSNHAPEQ